MSRRDWVSDFKKLCRDTVCANFVEALDSQMEGAESLCQSPIEVAMLYALRLNLVSPYDNFYSLGVEFWPQEHKNWPEGVCPVEGVWVFPQCQMGRYRVDFGILIVTRGRRQWFAVECDGHDFHERTKEQARSDKSRDRALLAQDVRVLRFTGSEIYQDADKCADEVHEALLKVFMEV